MIADSLQAGALLEYVCQHPAEDDARLVFADVLEERGEDARAEFIRLGVELAHVPVCEHERDGGGIAPASCRRCKLRGTQAWMMEGHSAPGMPALTPGWHGLPDDWFVCTSPAPEGWTRNEKRYKAWACVRRGFVAEVSLTAEAFAGGPCAVCYRGSVPTDSSDDTCERCHGTGRTPGHAAALFRMAPIVGVKLDREPYLNDAGQSVWLDGATYHSDAREVVPGDLFALLEGGELSALKTARYYKDNLSSHDALADAALLYGRRRGWPCKCWGVGTDGKPRPAFACPDCKGSGHTVTTEAPARHA